VQNKTDEKVTSVKVRDVIGGVKVIILRLTLKEVKRSFFPYNEIDLQTIVAENCLQNFKIDETKKVITARALFSSNYYFY
jgi:hypothetical protein